MFDASFQDPNLPKQSVQIRIPGVTIVNYLGPELGFNGLVDGIAGRLRTVHPGLPTALIDDITARACFSNMSGKPAFTANFQLEYLTPIPVERFIVMDAWVTCIERRKTFISTHLADAMTEPMLLSQTPDLVVLDRMMELESAVATVKSSLDNQASSYYSVASQIAE
ncbi:hypothetical protein FB639_004240 [Coemansia asiatica]|nr:hypothetical protein FB639_004240 [Coemansia asiatica]